MGQPQVGWGGSATGGLGWVSHRWCGVGQPRVGWGGSATGGFGNMKEWERCECVGSEGVTIQGEEHWIPEGQRLLGLVTPIDNSHANHA